MSESAAAQLNWSALARAAAAPTELKQFQFESGCAAADGDWRVELNINLEASVRRAISRAPATTTRAGDLRSARRGTGNTWYSFRLSPRTTK